MSDSPPSLPDNETKSEANCGSDVAWKFGGAVLGAIGLVAGARVRGFQTALLDPFGPVLLTIIALIGANVGALAGWLVFSFRLKRALKTVLTNTKADLIPPQEGRDNFMKRAWPGLAIINTGITIGGPIGAIGGWMYLASPPQSKGEFSMGILLLPFIAIKAIFFLFQVVIFATAGALIGALIGSLVSIFRDKH